MTKPAVIELSEDQQGWLGTMRLKRLRERGWRGSVVEYNVARQRLNFVDPLSRGETEPTEADRARAREIASNAEKLADPGGSSSTGKRASK